MQDGIELSGKLFRLVHNQRDATVAKVGNVCRLLRRIGKDGVGLGSGERNPFPFATFPEAGNRRLG